MVSLDDSTRDFALRVVILTGAICTVLVALGSLYMVAIVGKPLPEWMASALTGLVGTFIGVGSSLLGVHVGIPLTSGTMPNRPTAAKTTGTTLVTPKE